MKTRTKILFFAALAGVLLLAGVGLTMCRPKPVVDPAQIAQPAQTVPETAPEEPVWHEILINPWNRLPEDFSVELKEVEPGHEVDSRIAGSLEQMLTDARKEGLNPVICSAYRTQEKQEQLYSHKINRLVEAGYTQEEAMAEAGRWVAVPGTSEHQTGLAVDIIAADYPFLEQEQENTREQQWLMANAHRYGFILRYPKDKTQITGIGYEPWHYRYVGGKLADHLHRTGQTLEEYLEAEA